MVTKALADPARIYAVGDVHGQAERLRALHGLIETDLRAHPSERALLIHVGDYIDRGPASAACLSVLSEGDPIEGLETVNLMGNHERMLLDALARPGEAQVWRRNGGDATLASWGIAPDTPPELWRTMIPPAHLHFMEGLALSHVAGRFLFVHAGVRPGIRLAMQDPHDLLWIRTSFLEWGGTMLPDAPGLVVVHGHTPGPEPDVRRNRIGVDTNAGAGGKLTCAVLAGDSVYFLQA